MLTACGENRPPLVTRYLDRDQGVVLGAISEPAVNAPAPAVGRVIERDSAEVDPTGGQRPERMASGDCDESFARKRVTRTQRPGGITAVTVSGTASESASYTVTRNECVESRLLRNQRRLGEIVLHPVDECTPTVDISCLCKSAGRRAFGREQLKPVSSQNGLYDRVLVLTHSRAELLPKIVPPTIWSTCRKAAEVRGCACIRERIEADLGFDRRWSFSFSAKESQSERPVPIASPAVSPTGGREPTGGNLAGGQRLEPWIASQQTGTIPVDCLCWLPGTFDLRFPPAKPVSTSRSRAAMGPSGHQVLEPILARRRWEVT